MAKNIWSRLAAMSAFCAAACAADLARSQQDVLIPAPGPIEFNVQPLNLTAHPDKDVLIAFADDEEDAEESKPSEYWLGLQIASLPEVVKKQLAVEVGLAVEEVSEDSPAAKAEIKKYDILVKAGDTPLKSLSDLVKAVDASQGKEMTITIIRGGKDQTVKVIATKRPEGELKGRLALQLPAPEFKAEIKGLEEALENLKAKAGKDGVGFFFAKPGIVAPKIDVKIPEIAKGWKVDLPKNLNININKEGDQPAKIHVKQGDKEWNVTEDNLNELPEEIRHHVQRMQGHVQWKGPAIAATAARAIRVTPEGKVEGELKIAPTPPKPPVPPVRVTAPAAPQPPAFRLERRSADASDSKLDAILKEVQQLRKEVDELRTKSPGDARE